MLIDLHTHILPDLDDGAEDEDTAFQMLRQSYERGVNILAATPHYHCRMREDWEQRRQAAYETVCRMAAQISPELRVLLGAELLYESALPEQLKSGKNLTLNHTRSLLIEFLPDVNYLYIKNAVHTLQSMGYIPILAHIERYPALIKAERVEELSDMGAKMQVNADSVVGKNGWQLKRHLMRLMREDLIDLVATDAHDTEDRAPDMNTCAKYLERKLGSAYRDKVCRDNAFTLLGLGSEIPLKV